MNRARALGIKRLFDVLGAGAGLVVLSPVLVTAAVAVAVSMGRPILFCHERPGLKGESFRICKFRTMRPATNSEVWFRTDEQRLTRVGRFLRRTSIDELPQLWMVLRGSMSLVGPRPLLPQYLSLYTPEQARRHDMRPGITGWAQVHGRQTLKVSRRLELDVWYVDHFSLGLDMKILLMTIGDVFRSRGVLPGQNIDDVDDLDFARSLEDPDEGARRYSVAGYSVRRPEPSDVDSLYIIKNDPGIAALLAGTTRPFSMSDLIAWVDLHRNARDEAFFVIAGEGDRVLGHVALYRIDRTVASAEFGILVGDKAVWGKGLGTAFTQFMIEYGFDELDLRRIYLHVLETNTRARRLYEHLGFVAEGRLRQHQSRDGRFVDVLVMGLLRDEYRRSVDPERTLA